MVFEWYPSDNTECSKIDIQPYSTVMDAETADLFWWHSNFYDIVRSGYALSIICLIVALLIFALIPRLRNARVRIHINFFISMALQSMMWLFQGVFYADRIFLSLITKDTNSGNEPSLSCKILMVFGNYFELTSFTWISMESWYFYNFICREPYKEFTTIKPLIICGWGLPLFVIIPYLIVYSLATDTNFCWVGVDVKANILAIPIFTMILINICFFVLNVRVVFIKMNCSILHRRQLHFWKWFKSTLMLVPLFGVYDIFFSVDLWTDDKQFKTYFYNILRIFCSLQGFIVSTLYCFMNNEVKSEIKRAWQNWKSKREINCNICKDQIARRMCDK